MTSLKNRAGGCCSWHCAEAADGNVANLNHVVGSYNTITELQALYSLFTSMEVTLFRQDRQCWAELQRAIETQFRLGNIVVLNGRAKNNRWIHITCVKCGIFVYCPFGDASSRHVDKELHFYRSKLFELFMIPHRALSSILLPEV